MQRHRSASEEGQKRTREQTHKEKVGPNAILIGLSLSSPSVQINDKLSELRAVAGDDLADDLKSVNTRLVQLRERRSELRGRVQAQSKQSDDLINQLTSSRLRHIDQRFKTKLIDVKTHQLAMADLDTYARALDKALMHFHSIKMKEINETLKDYWRSVYKGADIDEIYIVSDGAIVGKKRNYNYRVVMKQGDTELDMRGRCSAGQKVLASLLIRLALADTFCSQCAVLALDEPVRQAPTRRSHKMLHSGVCIASLFVAHPLLPFSSVLFS